MLIFTTHACMQDIAFSVLFAMGFVAAGVAMAIFSKDWDDQLDSIGMLNLPSLESDTEDIRNSLAAGAVSYAISAS